MWWRLPCGASGFGLRVIYPCRSSVRVRLAVNLGHYDVLTPGEGLGVGSGSLTPRVSHRAWLGSGLLRRAFAPAGPRPAPRPPRLGRGSEAAGAPRRGPVEGAASASAAFAATAAVVWVAALPVCQRLAGLQGGDEPRGAARRPKRTSARAQLPRFLFGALARGRHAVGCAGWPRQRWVQPSSAHVVEVACRRTMADGLRLLGQVVHAESNISEALPGRLLNCRLSIAKACTSLPRSRVCFSSLYALTSSVLPRALAKGTWMLSC